MSRPLHYFLLFVWAAEVAAVAVGELLPGNMLNFRHMPDDKLLHFTGYFVAAALARSAFESIRRVVAVSLALVLLGVALEFGQKLVPGRQFEILDMVANAGGVAAGLAIGTLLRLLLLRLTRPCRGRSASHPVS